MSWSSLCKPSSRFCHGAGANPVPAMTSVIAGMSLKANRDAAVKGLLCQNSQRGSSWPLRQVPQDRWASLDQRSEPALGRDPSTRRGPIYQVGTPPSGGIPSIRQGSSPSSGDPLYRAISPPSGRILSIGRDHLPSGRNPSLRHSARCDRCQRQQ